MTPKLAGPLLAAVLVTTSAAACSDDDPARADDKKSSSPSPSVTVTESAQPDAESPAYKVAESRTREDSVYPNVGDPLVDALHYDLDLAWDPVERNLEGLATIAFRATADAPEFQLDLGDALEVGEVTVDGFGLDAVHTGNYLVVKSPVRKDEKYLLTVEYSGTPVPTAAPTTRSDFTTTGWTVTDDGEVWTMQEPYGAFTWYPVNDQPADKALYDFTISVPAPWTGVANGKLVSTELVEGDTVTKWHLDSPASSYLVTIAIGDYAKTTDKTASGIPVTYWTLKDDPVALERMRYVPKAMKWLEAKLGPYPFSTLGAVVVESDSAMETQTMPTFGNSDYSTSPEVVMHELCHQWYGDVVSPSDWSDVWMNEGMTMYLQMNFEADLDKRRLADVVDSYAAAEPGYRAEGGPPAAYDPTKFGVGNIYVSPAIMWHELRLKIGDERFWAMVKAWPKVHAEGNATRAEYLAWVEEETGEELTAFFDAWLLGKTSPKRS